MSDDWRKKNSNNSYNASDDTNDWNYGINKFINSLIHVCVPCHQDTPKNFKTSKILSFFLDLIDMYPLAVG